MSDHAESVNQRGHFLTPQQKEVKQKIMEELMTALFGNIARNADIFNIQSAADLTFSILIMFNRDVLTHTIQVMNLEGHRKQLMKDLFEQIKDQVNGIIKKGMQ